MDVEDSADKSRLREACDWSALLREEVRRHRVVGASLAVRGTGVDDDGLRIDAVAGTAHHRTGHPVTTDTLFQIGSITKLYTATLVMQLVREGRVQLDWPILDVLTDPAAVRVRRQTPTVRDLLRHTSGIDGERFDDTGRGDDCLQRYARRVLADYWEVHPEGALHSYSNTAYSLLGHLVERASGRIWDEQLRRSLLEPLGLTRTFSLPEEAILHPVAVGHVAGHESSDPCPVTTWQMPRAVGPAGLLVATAADVAAFAQAHAGTGGRGVPGLLAEDRAAMQASEVDVPAWFLPGASWGLGWLVAPTGHGAMLAHDGLTAGQQAFVRVFPDLGMVVVLLTNGGPGRDLFHRVVDEVLTRAGSTPLPWVAPRPVENCDPLTWVGAYARSDLVITVSARGDGLRVTTEGVASDGPLPATMDLLPAGPDLFVHRVAGSSTWRPVAFVRTADGRRYLHTGLRAHGEVRA